MLCVFAQGGFTGRFQLIERQPDRPRGEPARLQIANRFRLPFRLPPALPASRDGCHRKLLVIPGRIARCKRFFRKRALYAFRIEPYWVAVERHNVPMGDGHSPADPIRIVQLSDLHRSRIVPDSYLRKCVAKANKLEPDLVCMTGDYITDGQDRIEGLGRTLAGLQAKAGKFATFGNHDGSVPVSTRG